MSLLEQFRFLDPGPLIDRELELVPPEDRWIDGLLATLNDQRTRDLVPGDSILSREQLSRFVREFPLGRQNANPEKGFVPAYHFLITSAIVSSFRYKLFATQILSRRTSIPMGNYNSIMEQNLVRSRK